MRFGFGRRRRREADELPFPDEWRRTLATRWPAWQQLGDDERAHLESLIQQFLATKRWEAARGFELTEAMQVLIAAQAVLLVLELDLDLYRYVRTIPVHRSTVVLHGQRTTGTAGLASSDTYAIDGQAHVNGPLVLSWSAVSIDARHPERGRNVVLHEFAHQLDMLDGIIDGTPPMPDEALRERWVEVCTRELRALRRGRGGDLLREYGAQDPGEFFAVATEAFFCRPAELAEEKPELYDLLAAYYRQDPRRRVAPAA
jgi:Mlc titration factor MtfA (ptsG expression regulator)